MKKLLFVTTLSGFDLNRVPLGGPASISDALIAEYRKRSDFELVTLSSNLLGPNAPRNEDYLRYTPAQFIELFENFQRVAIAEIRRHDPKNTIVLSNETFRYQALTESGYPVVCMHHMNLIKFFTGVFLRDCISPSTAVAIHRGLVRSPLRRVLPKALELIFQNQEESVVKTSASVVPSEGLKRDFLRTYPQTPHGRIHVVPWGLSPEVCDDAAINARCHDLRTVYKIAEGTPVLITLSRISQEKGHDRLLEALQLWEKEASFPPQGVVVLLCGVSGYRQAEPFERKLKESAKNFSRVRIFFPGYLRGLEKQAHFRLADLYVFPSRYESYGLTLMEAFRAGLPAVACYNDGTEQLLSPDRGELIPAAEERRVPELLKQAIQRLLSQPQQLCRKGRLAKEFARTYPFSRTANEIADIALNAAQLV